MRTASLLALVVATLACGSEPPPSCGAIGRSAPCACPGGAQGAQECGPQGVWGVCVCPDGGAAEAGADAGQDAPGLEAAVDAPVEAGIDAAADASPAADADGGDAVADVAGDPLPPTADRLDDGGCPEGFAMCSGTACQNLMTSRMWCGDCRAFCGPLAECVGGRCLTRASGVSCGPGRGDCDGDAANGCETDTWTDRANCGGCGRACTSAMRCFEGACVAGGGG